MAVLVAALPGCVATGAPPPPRGAFVPGGEGHGRAHVAADTQARAAEDARSRPPAPSAGSVWHEGYWHWSGTREEWRPGYWEEPDARDPSPSP
jgi:hypothetical protein